MKTHDAQTTVHTTSRRAFREAGSVVPTRAPWRRARHWLLEWAQACAWPAGGLAAVMAFFMLAGYLDETARLQQEAGADIRQAFELGRAKGHAEMVASAEAAWAAAAQVDEARCARAAR
ncbi:MAG: hypothetical protein Q8K45_21265 [Rubrivivax sp.]|nr:hypothetical protein [Rubrivivax sp.]